MGGKGLRDSWWRNNVLDGCMIYQYWQGKVFVVQMWVGEAPCHPRGRLCSFLMFCATGKAM